MIRSSPVLGNDPNSVSFLFGSVICHPIYLAVCDPDQIFENRCPLLVTDVYSGNPILSSLAQERSRQFLI